MCFLASIRAKVSKYGDRLLETIESTIREHHNTDKNSSGSNDSTDSIKRRRDATRAAKLNVEEEDDFTKSTGRSKKRAAKLQNKDTEVYNARETDQNQCLDDDLDFEDSCYDHETTGSAVEADKNGTGRVLPSWSTPGNKIKSSNHNLFQEYAMNS